MWCDEGGECGGQWVILLVNGCKCAMDWFRIQGRSELVVCVFATAMIQPVELTRGLAEW